jgi:lysophospholipase L1-like esterase
VWTKEKTIQRSTDSWSLWAKQAAAQSGASFFDLNDRLASRYEQLGPDVVKSLFADGTHTTAAGAVLSAEVVVDGLKELALAPLAETILPKKR